MQFESNVVIGTWNPNGKGSSDNNLMNEYTKAGLPTLQSYIKVKKIEIQ